MGEKKHIKYLDGIRILSSILVCISHANQYIIAPKLGSTSKLFLTCGYAASYSVIAFFILSGYLITKSIYNNSEKNSNKFHFIKYWQDRLIRLYPPLIFSIILCVLIFGIVHKLNLHGHDTFRLPNDVYLARESITYSPNELFSCLFFLQGFTNVPMNMNGPLWTLGDEFFLYVIASFFALFFFNKNKFSLLLVLLFTLIVVYTGHIHEAIYFYIIWFGGAMFAWYERQNTLKIGRRFTVLLSCFSLICLVSLFVIKGSKLPAVNYHLINKFIVIQFLSIVFVISTFHLLPLKIKNKVIDFFSLITPKKDFTYTLYVIHQPIILLAFSLSHIWLSKNSLLTSILFVAVLISLIIFIANKLAFYLEDTVYFKKLVGISKNNITKLHSNQ